MATVRITEKLIDSTLTNVRKKFEPAMEAAKASLDTTGWADRIYETMYRDYLPQINALPANFFVVRGDIELRIPRNSVLFSTDRMDLKFAAPRPIPHTTPEHPCIEQQRSYTVGDYKIKSWDAWPDLGEAYDAWTARVKRVGDDHQTMRQSVEHLLRSHSTLAPCIKKWPALWDLLSDEYRDKHREVVERKAKDSTPDYGLDFDHMTAMVAKAKLRGV